MGERVWLKGVYLRELMVHVSVHHVLSLGYKFMYGVQAVFFALQIIAIYINKKTHLSCRNNRRLNRKNGSKIDMMHLLRM